MQLPRPHSTRRVARRGAGVLLASALAATVALVVATGLAGCGGRSSSAPRPGGDTSSGSAGTASLASSPSHRVTKLLVFMVENHSLREMRSAMPFTYGLAKQFAYATDYHGIRHPSLPNYLAIAGGSTFGVTDDASPSSHRIKGRSVFGQALRSHRTAKVYADGMPANCALENGGNHYAVRHNPWTYFVGERKACRRYDVPLRALATDVSQGTLPNAGMVVPNLMHDAHDGTLAAADAWIQKEVDMVRQGRDWRSGRLAIVITADEDDDHHGNRVLTVVASRSAAHHKVVGRRLNHYALTRLYDDVLGVGRLRHARQAPSMARAFAIPVR